jgi:hypothetical protein
MRRAGITALLALLAAGAAAHPAPNSLFKLDFRPAGVRAEYWVPLSELAYARTAEPGGDFADYLLRHVAVESARGAAWRVSVAGVRETCVRRPRLPGRGSALLPPARESPRPLVLVDDAVTHEVRNHVIYVVDCATPGRNCSGCCSTRPGAWRSARVNGLRRGRAQAT